MVNSKDDDNRPFPIQGGTYWDRKTKDWCRPIGRYSPCVIPWWLAEEVYKIYAKKFGTGQSLERLAERGGFTREEMLYYLSECEDWK